MVLSGSVHSEDEDGAEADTVSVSNGTELSGSTENDPGGLYTNRPEDTTLVTQRPTEALFKSMIIPGWGQWDNHKYIKSVVIAGTEIALMSAIIHYAKKKSDFEERYKEETDEAEKLILFNSFRDAKNERNRFSWYLGSLIFLSMFDAFVDAHLARFPKISEDISLDVKSNDSRGLALFLNYNF